MARKPKVIRRKGWVWVARNRNGRRIFNPELRRFCAGHSGVYAFRDAKEGIAEYVGESHSGRLWKTATRHFQGLESGLFRYAHSSHGGPTEWVHGAPESLEAYVWITHARDAMALEALQINRLEPLGNANLERESEGYYDDEVPF